MKEAFVERKLDEIQPGWRDGEDITAETKEKIREYVASKMPDDFMDDISCLTDYSIRNMATKIRERESLPKPKKTNKGNAKVAVSEPSPSEGILELKTPTNIDNKESLVNIIRQLVKLYSLEAVKRALAESQGFA
jgi:hypothetical protein